MEWFRRERAWINEKHLQLCRIPAPTFFEQQRAEWMAEQFRSLGWEAKIDRAGNVVAVLPQSGHRNMPSVAVTAHLDTVLAPRTFDDIKLLGDGRFTGPGVADNGPGLVALLALAAAWTAHAPLEEFNAAPVLVANVGEEGEGNLSGMRYFCRQPSLDQWRGFLVLDGPGLEHITSRALASRRFEIVITGPGGHSWRDAQNSNPVHALSRVVTLFSEQVRRIELDGNTAGNARASFNFGIFEGGASINSIPSEARAKLDLRSESTASLDYMVAILATVVEQATSLENANRPGAPVAARVKEIGSRPAGDLRPDAPILETLRAVDHHLNIRSRLDCSSTDANVPLSLGLQAVSIGVGGQGGGAHTSSEWYLAEGREIGLRRVLLTLCLLLLRE